VLAFIAFWGKSSPQFFFAEWLQVADLNLVIPIEASAITLGACVLITGLEFAGPNLCRGLPGNGLGLGPFLRHDGPF
jgi:hypothetical protein